MCRSNWLKFVSWNKYIATLAIPIPLSNVDIYFVQYHFRDNTEAKLGCIVSKIDKVDWTMQKMDNRDNTEQ